MSFAVLTTGEAAKIARISTRHLLRLMAEDMGPPVTRIGRRVLLPADSFQEWVMRGTPSPSRRYVAVEPAEAASFVSAHDALDHVRQCQVDLSGVEPTIAAAA